MSLADNQAAALLSKVHRLRREIGKVIVGHDELVEQVIVALLGGGHVLLEGAPGLGKTRLVRALADALELRFSRIQFTPDLMPADILGTFVLQTDPHGGPLRQIAFQRGPIFAHLVLADEVNRATPKTQSALLEAMQERSVTVAGHTFELESPFFVIATQNPIEMEGTYPLPEAQIDRFFFKLLVAPPGREELRTIVERTTGESEPQVGSILARDELLEVQRLVRQVPVASHVVDFAVSLVLATRPGSSEAPAVVNQYVRFGASPRAAQALILAAKARALLEGRYNAAIEDVVRCALPALRHRVLLAFEAQADGVEPDQVVRAVLDSARQEVAS